MGALLQGGFKLVCVSTGPDSQWEWLYQWDCICWFGLELMCQFFIVGYQMGDVNVAVVLFYEDVLPDLISVCVGSVYGFLSEHLELPVDEGIVEPKL